MSGEAVDGNPIPFVPSVPLGGGGGGTEMGAIAEGGLAEVDLCSLGGGGLGGNCCGCWVCCEPCGGCSGIFCLDMTGGSRANMSPSNFNRSATVERLTSQPESSFLFA